MSEYKTPNFSIDLSGQIALVTGASSGLGYRFSKVLASCGAKVAISARRKEKLESLSEEIKQVMMEIGQKVYSQTNPTSTNDSDGETIETDFSVGK